jgi:hypothetical protein
MRKLITFFTALALTVGVASAAHAASCFWVGGTATWDGTNTGGGGTGGIKWASASGGASACAGGGTGGSPTSGDTATFDGSSGGGTVTVNTTVIVSGITCGAFTGTLDFSVNNNNVTIGSSSFNCSGTGTRTLSMGNGTWTISGGSGTPWTIATATGLTFHANSSTIALQAPSGAQRTFNGGGLTYNTITIPASVAAAGYIFNGNNTFANFNVTAPANIAFTLNTTTTITNAINWTGSSGSYIFLQGGTGAQATISSANNGTITWAALSGIAFTGGGSFAATNSFDLQNNSGVTITAPSTGGGGGGHIIGGGL